MVYFLIEENLLFWYLESEWIDMAALLNHVIP